MKDVFPNSGYYQVKVIPRQREAEIREVLDDGTIKLALTAAPEKGKANKELITFLADEIGVSKDCISLVSGVASRLKVISVDFSCEENSKA